MFFQKKCLFSIPIPFRTLCWLCFCATVVVCCRCVLHRLCSTTCKHPCLKLGVSLFRHPCRKPLPRGEGLCMLSWLCICAIVVVCCRCVLHRLCSTTCMRPCIEPLGIHARHPCRAECGAAALTKQGRLQSATQSHYARTHNDSHTKPLHDATAQMAVNAQMQRHQRLMTCIGATPKARRLWLLAKSFARCKTSRASNAKHPFSKTYRFIDSL